MAWPVFESVCFTTLAAGLINTKVLTQTDQHTCEAVTSILPNEYRTLDSLLEYIRNDVCETLQLV
jgi:hypothetical protein